MDYVRNLMQSRTVQTNRWIIPVGGILLAGLIVGLATMYVIPAFRKDPIRNLEDRGRGIKKRTQSRAAKAASRVMSAIDDVQEVGKKAIEDAADTVQDQAKKVKKAARKAKDQSGI